MSDHKAFKDVWNQIEPALDGSESARRIAWLATHLTVLWVADQIKKSGVKL